MPHLEELYEKHAKDGLVIVAVHSQKGGEKMPAFVRDQRISYPTAWDKDGKTTKAFAVDSYPDYYLVDRAGRLRFADLANSELDRAIKALLAEEVPAPEPAEGAEVPPADDGG